MNSTVYTRNRRTFFRCYGIGLGPVWPVQIVCGVALCLFILSQQSFYIYAI